ncbi:uncharacterized protein N7482_003244 [Penicillium canariense]|uniref:DUF3752 domain-containing protein n=1 Tax=Penicillium canariense TaxID=189055 RepID=A0A9W9LP46_9EURO|nr:uncharacterized protein N7482_003244 [Penicillium canariense]KAJ5167650.1 hypothetical protein N7482_003244 [Penicillium canariense]
MELTDKRKLDFGPDGDEPSPKKRVIGPSLPPPQPLDAPESSSKDAHSDSNSDSDSDSDDDFGPGLPPSLGGAQPARQFSEQQASQISETQKKESQRDEWMLHPPSQSDWASKIDPTQLRNRKFQTGKSARSSTSKQVDATWIETPEERMRRLEDEMLGVGAPSKSEGQRTPSSTNPARAKEMEEKIKKFNDQSGTNTRLDKDQPARKEEEDDPSSRAFDREKDMAVSSKITNAQRREMINKASDYSSRFSKGNYL